MMTKTPVVIALGLLLASTLVASPANAIGGVPAECQETVLEMLVTDQKGVPAKELRDDCAAVPPLPKLCRAPAVGTDDLCVTPPPVSYSVCRGSYGAMVYAGEYGEIGRCQTLPAVPTVKVCPAGTYGVRVDGSNLCVDPETGTCLDSPTPVNLQRCGVQACTGPTYGVVLQWFDGCIDPLAFVPETPSLPNPDAPQDPECMKTEDDPGVGGTRVSCKYSCWSQSELAIGVRSSDAQATVYGMTSCGGANAACNEPTFVCADVSRGLTTRNDKDQECRGNSDEFNDSPLLVYCTALGLSTLCDLLGELEICNPALSASQACLGLHPELALNPELLAIIRQTPVNANSLVAFQGNPAGGVAIRYEKDAAAPQAFCSLAVYDWG